MQAGDLLGARAPSVPQRQRHRTRGPLRGGAQRWRGERGCRPPWGDCGQTGNLCRREGAGDPPCSLRSRGCLRSRGWFSYVPRWCCSGPAPLSSRQHKEGGVGLGCAGPCPCVGRGAGSSHARGRTQCRGRVLSGTAPLLGGRAIPRVTPVASCPALGAVIPGKL